MTRKITIISALLTVAMAWPAQATATNLVDPSGAPAPWPFPAWAASSPAQIPGPVVIDPDASVCGRQVASCYIYGSNPPRIYIDCRRTENNGFGRGYGCRRALLHELGHMADDRILREADRNAVMRILGRVSLSREHVAEAYRMCALYPRRKIAWWREFSEDYFPTLPQHLKVCRVLRAAVG